MQNICELSEVQVFELLRALTVADRDGRSFRITTGTNKHGTFYQYSIGQGMWTPPKYTNWVE